MGAGVGVLDVDILNGIIYIYRIKSTEIERCKFLQYLLLAQLV